MVRALALNEATKELTAGLKVCGIELSSKIIEALARRAIRAYILEERSARKVDGRIAPATVEMSTMEVGEIIELEPCAPQVLRARMKSARKLMNNMQASWSVWSRDGKSIVTRQPDGTRPTKNPFMNKRAVFLASLLQNQGFVVADCFPRRQALCTSTKISARKILGNPNADWAVTVRKGKVLVRRSR